MSLLRQTLDAIHEGGNAIMVMLIASEIVAQWAINRRTASKNCPHLIAELKTHGVQVSDIKAYWQPALMVAQLAANVSDFRYPRPGEVRHDC